MKRFVDAQMPSFVEKVNGMKDLTLFQDKADRNGLPQVLLFTAKPNTSPLTKYLSTEFRRRILLAEVRTTKPNQDILKKYGITDFPAIVVIPPASASEDEEGNAANGDATTRDFIRYEGDGFTRNKLHSFLSQHALKSKVFPKKKATDGEAGDKEKQSQEPRKENVKTEL
mmetsp:Transcript_13517/g.28741  ORF Transcript_13517/g.28741 Transcript_13517/m.28741 type:complete len:170 (-) Transcript_13517:2369-2878(-)